MANFDPSKSEYKLPKKSISPNQYGHGHFEENIARIANANAISRKEEETMLSSVTINCQVTKIVINSGSQLSEL